MIIKKFKSGTLNLKLEKSDFFYYGTRNPHESHLQNININIDNLYDGEITMNDLCFNSINGYMYLMDYNKGLMYDFSSCYINILLYIKELLLNGYKNNQIIKLYPISKKESKQLFIDLENEC